MLHPFFQTPIEYAKGVGPQRAEVLKSELGVFTSGDLLFHFPSRYVDRSRYYKINELTEDMPYVQLRGKIISMKSFGSKRTTRIVATFKDESGMIDLIWFQGITWVRDSIKAGVDYVVFGKPSLFNGKINIVHPEMETFEKFSSQTMGNFQPVYSTTEKCKAKGLDSKGIMRLLHGLTNHMPVLLPETLPMQFLQALKLMPLRDALLQIHFPDENNSLKNAIFRFKFEELFYIQLKLLLTKQSRNEKYKGKIIEQVGYYFNSFYKNNLPFALTDAQKRVIKEIRKDTNTGKQMNRLLQGDVGSGKTIVALLSMLLALDNKCQTCLMAPTEILAQQHFASLTQLLKGIPVEVALLTGSTRESERKNILKSLSENKIHILIGTHALIEDKVQFSNLGLVVIDEQHRFGVEQRARLWMKENPPHVLVMTATPIPRTLAMTLYGDLDVSVIDQMPPGRKPIKTLHYFESARLRIFGFMKEQIKEGRQIYVVYPLIDESEKLDFNNLMSGYDNIVREFPLPHYHVSIVHGRLKPKDKEYEMQQFVKGKTNIMIATTVIEVGVNVPNASVMIIESAERFGLSQLHQLRGRVGRGANQSYCILLTGDKIGNVARERMKTMVQTNDGFEIAETDLRLRGPGDITGTQQSGLLDLKIAELSKDQLILELARKAAIDLLSKDAHLEHPENKICITILNSKIQEHKNWSRVS